MRPVIAAVEDVFFKAKISEMAQQTGTGVAYVSSFEELREAVKEELPKIILIDLNFEGFQPVDALMKMRIDAEMKIVTKIGFLSHVQQELKEQALLAGCQHVLPRSEFVKQLPGILKKHSKHHMEGLFHD